MNAHSGWQSGSNSQPLDLSPFGREREGGREEGEREKMQFPDSINFGNEKNINEHPSSRLNDQFGFIFTIACGVRESVNFSHFYFDYSIITHFHYHKNPFQIWKNMRKNVTSSRATCISKLHVSNVACLLCCDCHRYHKP